MNLSSGDTAAADSGADNSCAVSGAQYAEAGFIFVDKPCGPTSATIVAKIKRALRNVGVTRKETKVGHGGTLDPMATGLLVVLLGRATKLADYALHANKGYSGSIQLGITTDTDDVTGAQIGERRTVPRLTAELLQPIMHKFIGPISQMPPAFSALKINGERAYDLARAGKVVELEARSVTVSRCDLAVESDSTLHFDIDCSGGTYIRSLARDIGAELGCGGTLAELRRQRSGRFDIEMASRWEEHPSGLPSSLAIQPWWNLLPAAQHFAVDFAVSQALAGGEQRVLAEFASQFNGIGAGELLLYCVGNKPHGVVRSGVRGLELLLHVGDSKAESLATD